MAEIVLYIATSLDGFIADENGGVDWLFTDQDYGYPEFYASVDAVLIGGKTYAQALDFTGGQNPYADKPTYVFTTKQARPMAGASGVAGDVGEIVDPLKAQHAGTLWLVGGMDLIRQFRERNLIDWYVLSVHPTLLGRGLPLFAGELPMQGLTLEGVQPFDSGLVQLTYRKSTL